MQIKRNNIFQYIFLCLALFSCSQTSSDKLDFATVKTTDCPLEKDPIDNFDELSKFVPKNYSILDTVSGDLNFDGIEDYILVLKKDGEDTLSDVVAHPERRPLLILLRDKNNRLQLTRRNDNTVYCIDCGGMLGDPFVGITIKNGCFSVEHYGGSAWRWTKIITYKFSKEDDEWFLYKDGLESFHTSDPEKIESIIKTQKDFGKVKFEAFDIYQE